MNRKLSKTLANVVLMTVLALGSLSGAHAYELFAGDPVIPGTAQLESGAVEKAIEEFEKQTQSVRREVRSSAFTGLCAAYVMKGDLGVATQHCERAVDYGQRAAFNNRGVLRANQGDFAGAQNDFQRAKRPPGKSSLDSSEIRYLASRNLDRVIDIQQPEVIYAGKDD